MDNAPSSLYSERYKRQLQLPGFGPDAQQKLVNAKVLVIGAGGLGVPVLQYLTGMGIGTLGIIDGDLIEHSNLHRQVLYTSEEVGLPKALAAEKKLSLLNNLVNILCYPVYLTPENALDIIRKFDIVVDATDNFSARYLINDSCVILGRPFIYGSVHRYEGHVSVFNLGDGPTYRCLYPTMPSASEIPDCNTAGVLGIVPGMIGSRQALEVVKLITGIGPTLSGQLLIMDVLNDRQHKIMLHTCATNKQIKALQESYTVDECTNNSFTITPEELHQWFTASKEFLLVDVRMEDEFEKRHLPKSVSRPLNALYQGAFSFDEKQPLVLYCQAGSRSAKAAAFLHQRQPALQIFELSGGIDNWLRHQFLL